VIGARYRNPATPFRAGDLEGYAPLLKAGASGRGSRDYLCGRGTAQTQRVPAGAAEQRSNSATPIRPAITRHIRRREDEMEDGGTFGGGKDSSVHKLQMPVGAQRASPPGKRDTDGCIRHPSDARGSAQRL